MSVKATRNGDSSYTGTNERGASVQIGRGEGQFTPGELLQLALGACQALSADHNLAHFLSDTFPAEFTVDAEAAGEGHRYASMDVHIDAHLDTLPEDRRAKAQIRAEHAIERYCTVGRTLDAGMPHTLSID